MPINKQNLGKIKYSLHHAYEETYVKRFDLQVLPLIKQAIIPVKGQLFGLTISEALKGPHSNDIIGCLTVARKRFTLGKPVWHDIDNLLTGIFSDTTRITAPKVSSTSNSNLLIPMITPERIEWESKLLILIRIAEQQAGKS